MFKKIPPYFTGGDEKSVDNVTIKGYTVVE
jgi:hypothetical protein